MRNLKWVLLGTLLAAILAGSQATLSATVSAADVPITLTVYNPTGASQVTDLFAPRLSDLKDKTICELSLGIWEAPRTFPAIRDLLTTKYGAKVVPYDQLPPLSETKDVVGLEDAVKKAGCQGVIVGNAG